MLQVSNLTITHLKDLKDLVRDLTLTVNAGDRVAIIGEEGNGKSTLLKLMMEPSLVTDYVSCSGQIQRAYSSYSYLPQQLPEQEAQLTLNDYFFADTEADLDYAKLYRYAQELHFDSQRFASSQVLSSLSGGEKLKVQLIKKLASDADMLFLDEPSNDLDLDTLIWLEDFIKQTDKTVLFVSHDENLLTKAATKIVHLERIKKKQEARTTVRNLAYEDYSQQRQEAFDKQSQQAKKEREEHAKTMNKHQRVKQNVENALRNTKNDVEGRLLAKKMKNVLSQGKRFEQQAAQMTEIPTQEEAIKLRFSDIEALPLTKRILKMDGQNLEVGGRLLAKNLSLEVTGQEKIGIIGANGAGKSSLLKEMWGSLCQRTDLRAGYMPQHYGDLLDQAVSPLDFLAPTGHKASQEKALTHLASLQFTREEARHPISQLSGGQRAKLLLLKLVLDRPNVLLLDEPTRNFSPTSQPQVRQLFAHYPGAIMTVSHDRAFLKQVCQKLYRLTEEGLEEVGKDSL
ncbi:ATP-binding cassette domain-containing protein [Streptococcus panodentis]|uniref:Multidrug ABC transporter ATP-binding protein n=1 Tax=Streptococcus panodentis TaxID=1581472 RepID=A0ABS5AZ86_9STRE|nr:ATP-binding cassette domain-containing protein [Streptococcus panodentis]MBP2621558.1 multidrug ABC transporter ATP-binding protein [Streptococcus panodentis]